GQINDGGGGKQGLEQASEGGEGEHFLDAGRRTQPRTFRSKRSGGKDETALGGGGKKGGAPSERERKRSGTQDERAAPVKQRHSILKLSIGGCIEDAAEKIAPLSGKTARLRGDDNQHGGSGGAGHQFAAARHLALLACFLPASGCRFFAFTAIRHASSLSNTNWSQSKTCFDLSCSLRAVLTALRPFETVQAAAKCSSRSPAARARANSPSNIRGHSARVPASAVKPIRFLTDKPTSMTGSLGEALPRKPSATSTSSVARITGIA